MYYKNFLAAVQRPPVVASATVFNLAAHDAATAARIEKMRVMAQGPNLK
ncbi:MAG: hypothetical protein V4621_04705 [Pseudomonadota bacterium]